MKTKLYITVLSIFFVNGLYSQYENDSLPVFHLQSANAGITWGSGNSFNFSGNGVSVADFNDDGLDDLTICTNNGLPIFFYVNNGNGFDLITSVFVPNFGDVKQLVWVDFDNDGDKDIFLTQENSSNKLYEHINNFEFQDVTNSKGISMNNYNAYGANFGDIDKDGFLDLYVCNYNFQNFSPQNEFYKFDASNNSYINHSIASGACQDSSQSFCSTFFDYDFDGDIDLYIANDRINHNLLFQNDGTGIFTDVSQSTNADVDVYAMNTGTADYNVDGFWDIFVSNHVNNSFYNLAVLLKGNSNYTFSDVATSTQANLDQINWTANFLDLENDRDLDVYASNSSFLLGPSSLLLNVDGTNFFQPFENSNGIAAYDSKESYCNGIIDADNNGIPDILNPHYGGTPFALYMNYAQTENNFLKIDLEGVLSNKDAFGALVEVWIRETKTVFHKYSTNAYLNQPSSYINIGLGNEVAVDSLVIYWPFANSKDVILGSDLTYKAMNKIFEGNTIPQTKKLNFCADSLTTAYNPLPSKNYFGDFYVKSSSAIKYSANVQLSSNNLIELNAGFAVDNNSSFEAIIQNCSQ